MHFNHYLIRSKCCAWANNTIIRPPIWPSGRFEVGKRFREQEFLGKLEKAGSLRMKGYKDMIVEKGYKMFYQTQNKKVWLGPAVVKEVERI